MKHIFCLLAFSLCALPIVAEESTSLKTHRVPQLENPAVKVWKTVIMPYQPLQMHRHERPRIVIGLKGGTLKRIEEDGRASDLVFETGKAYWLEADPEGELHSDINESDEPIEVMIVQFK